MRYFLQRLITRGDYESAAVLAKNNELWLPSDLLRQDEFTPLNLFVYRMARTQKVKSCATVYIPKCFSA